MTASDFCDHKTPRARSMELHSFTFFTSTSQSEGWKALVCYPKVSKPVNSCVDWHYTGRHPHKILTCKNSEIAYHNMLLVCSSHIWQILVMIVCQIFAQAFRILQVFHFFFPLICWCFIRFYYHETCFYHRKITKNGLGYYYIQIICKTEQEIYCCPYLFALC